ncbi:PEP/pyruvate-binding domain-containing protein [Shewanella maritima]|uniref:PEP/pyruvate-binding domain-containing protein n=1 Tax=Shewanella maritima TaxID=2520507 RepID=UPI003735ED74
MIDFGTKSETLAKLSSQTKQSRILPLMYFTQQQWMTSPSEVLYEIKSQFREGKVIVRSSAINEDGANSSMAGAFTSVLDIDVTSEQQLEGAINDVIASFANTPTLLNQVLIQPMLKDIQMSGVVMTHDIQNGAPYYTINYDDESGKTDTITGGIGTQKTVLIYRGTALADIRSSRIRQLIVACQELELLFGKVPLDIEFAINTLEQVYILQVRRITLSNTWHPLTEKRVARQLHFVSQFLTQHLSRKPNVFGESSILGSMPDWNPAEIIGATPRPLASSLYRYVITDNIWLVAREKMGYYAPAQRELMQVIANHPYIDVRTSFNSFLPKSIAPDVAERLIDAWIMRLSSHPELHDKVEFEVAFTCCLFNFKSQFTSRYPSLLSDDELDSYQQQLTALTMAALQDEGDGSLSKALSDIDTLATIPSHTTHETAEAQISHLKQQLALTKTLGTLPFSIIARHAFIAESLLHSAVEYGALSPSRLNQWKRSISTVSGKLTQHYADVLSGSLHRDEFIKQFGHLRPSTYDITSLRYDERSDLFTNSTEHIANSANELDATSFEWAQIETDKLTTLLQESGLDISVERLFSYARQAIEAREYAKFVFTKHLSDSLHVIEHWGLSIGLSRDDLSYLDLKDIIDTLTVPLLDTPDRLWFDKVNQAKLTYQQSCLLKLGHLICQPDDVFVVPLHRAMPNYITLEVVTGTCIKLTADTSAATNLAGKIVCIENADPGFDWIFTKGISGLITQYGGANSHMAIRCAEFGIPAAIGCGEQLFEQLAQSQVVLNCRDKQIVKTS